jgi:hypothetical protein
MAQWNGWGHSHHAHVEFTEEDLRHAVGVFRVAESAPEKNKKAKSVRNLAKRLLSARLRLYRSRIRDWEPVTGGEPSLSRSIDSLRQQEKSAIDGGVDAILAEFNAADAKVSEE